MWLIIKPTHKSLSHFVAVAKSVWKLHDKYWTMWVQWFVGVFINIFSRTGQNVKWTSLNNKILSLRWLNQSGEIIVTDGKFAHFPALNRTPGFYVNVTLCYLKYHISLNNSHPSNNHPLWLKNSKWAPPLNNCRVGEATVFNWHRQSSLRQPFCRDLCCSKSGGWSWNGVWSNKLNQWWFRLGLNLKILTLKHLTL